MKLIVALVGLSLGSWGVFWTAKLFVAAGQAMLWPVATLGG